MFTAQKALTHFTTRPKTVEQSIAAGKVLRTKHPISEMGDYTLSPKRADPMTVFEAQGKTRLPDLMPIRYARMLTSSVDYHRVING